LLSIGSFLATALVVTKFTKKGYDLGHAVVLLKPDLNV